MDIDKLKSRADLARELGLNPEDPNFQWNVEQTMANWDKRDVQQVKNKFFPKIIGAGTLHLSIPRLVRRTRSRSDTD